MNIKDAFLLPWRRNQRGMRWLALALFAVTLIGTAALGAFSRKPDLWVRLALVMGIVQALIWPLYLATTILLSVEAKQLRLPGVQRQAFAAALFNWLPAVLLPALVLGAFVGHAVAIAMLIALLTVAGSLYILLPRFVGLAFYIAFLVLIDGDSLRQWLTSAGFLDAAWPALAAGMALVVVCWRRLLLAPDPYEVSWQSPMMVRLSRGMRAAASRSDSLRISRRPDWLQARGDLRRCGPGHPVTTLRMAMGGPYMPRTGVGRLRQYAVLAGLAVLLVGWIVFASLRDADFHAFTRPLGGEALGLLVLSGTMMIVIDALISPFFLASRWRRVNAELPVLALLPELGCKVKRDLLRAALWPPLRTLALAALLVLAVLSRVGVRQDFYALLVVVGTAGFVVAFSLGVVGGYRSDRWKSVIGAALGFLLFLGTVISFALSLDPDTGRSDADVVGMLLLVGWVIAAVMMFRLGRRGWRGLQRRPHPFLVN